MGQVFNVEKCSLYKWYTKMFNQKCSHCTEEFNHTGFQCRSIQLVRYHSLQGVVLDRFPFTEFLSIRF